MNKSNATFQGTKGTSKLVRAKFGPGMLLQHEDLELLNAYTRQLSRLMFGSLFGCGVICGLVVKTETKCGKVQVTVGAGVALGCSGDPIQVPADQTFPLSDDCPPDLESPLWVVLCGTMKCCAPRTSLCEGDDDETKSECTRERDGFEIRVVSERPTCICGCPEPGPSPVNNPPPPEQGSNPAVGASRAANQPGANDCKCVDPTLECYVDHYAGRCGCHCDDCSDCDCKCVLLARLDREGDTDRYTTDHSVRRFIRPVLMRDPQVEIERTQPPAPTPTPAPAPAPTPKPTPAPTPAATPQAEGKAEPVADTSKSETSKTETSGKTTKKSTKGTEGEPSQ